MNFNAYRKIGTYDVRIYTDITDVLKDRSVKRVVYKHRYHNFHKCKHMGKYISVYPSTLGTHFNAYI